MEKDVILAVALLVLAWAYISRVNDLARQTNQLERMLLAIAKKLDVPLPYIPDPPSQRVQDLAQDRKKKVEAIKAYREETGAGLKEALEVIDQLRSQRESVS